MDSEVGEADLALNDGGEVRAAGVTEGSDEDRNEAPRVERVGGFLAVLHPFSPVLLSLRLILFA